MHYFPVHIVHVQVSRMLFYYTAAQLLKLPWNLLQIWVLQYFMWNNAKPMQEIGLINLFNGGPRGGTPRWRGSTPREAPRHSAWHASRALVQLSDDWVADFFQLFLLMFKFFLFCSLKRERNYLLPNFRERNLHARCSLVRQIPDTHRNLTLS